MREKERGDRIDVSIGAATARATAARAGASPAPTMIRLPFRVLTVGAILTVALVAVAFAWSYIFLIVPSQETLDQQAQDVASQLKCPVCQGESVADSPSTIARQMRAVIRQQLQARKSKQQVIQYFVDRYGDQIIWSPPWQGFFLIAWLVPITLLLAGAVLLFFILRNWRAATPLDATTEEQELSDIDEAELERYRAQLEQELAADDPIFRQPRTEVS